MYRKHIAFQVQEQSLDDDSWTEHVGIFPTIGDAIVSLKDRAQRKSHLATLRLVAIDHAPELDQPGFRPNRATVIWEGKRVPNWLGQSQEVGATDWATNELKVGA